MLYWILIVFIAGLVIGNDKTRNWIIQGINSVAMFLKSIKVKRANKQYIHYLLKRDDGNHTACGAIPSLCTIVKGAVTCPNCKERLYG